MTKYYINGMRLVDWCLQTKTPYNTILFRMKEKGLTIDEACKMKKCMTYKHFLKDGTTLADYCRQKGINYKSIETRILRHRLCCDDAIVYKRKRRTSKIKPKCKDINHYKRALRKIKKGWIPDMAIEYSKRPLQGY